MLIFQVFGLLVLYTIANSGLGYLILSLLRRIFRTELVISPLNEFATAFLLGGGFLANLWVLLALMGLFQPALIALFIIILMLGAVPYLYNNYRNLLKQSVSIVNHFLFENWPWKIIILGISASTIMWLTSLGRPLSGDGVSFYMAIAKLFAYTHQLVKLPGYDDFSSVGLQGEMHYAALMSLGSVGAAKLFSLPTMLGGSVMLLALGRLAGMGRRGQWLVLAIVLTSTSISFMSGSGKTDLSSMALALAAYYWVTHDQNRHSYFFLVLTGLFTGLAIIAKLSYLLLLGIGIPILLLWNAKDQLNSRAKRNSAVINLFNSILVLLSGILIAILPHLIKNWIIFNNPIAPFGAGTLGWADQTWFDQPDLDMILSTYPLQLFYGLNWAQMGNLSPLMLALLPLLLVLFHKKLSDKNAAIGLLLSSFISLFIWAILRPSIYPRFILATLLLFAIPIALSAEFLSYHEAKPRLTSGAIILVTIFFLITNWLKTDHDYFQPENTIKYLMNQVSECQLNKDFCPAVELLNERANPGERIFFLPFQRFYLRADLLQCIPNEQETNTFRALEYPDQRWRYIYNRGFRYVIYFAADEKVKSILEGGSMPEGLKITTILDSPYKVLQIDSDDSIKSPGTACEQVNPLTWEILTY